jgi:hypothetical protein
VEIYQNGMIHVKDVCIQIAHNAVCKKYKIIGKIDMTDKKVLRKIRKSWESRFPELLDYFLLKKKTPT